MQINSVALVFKCMEVVQDLFLDLCFELKYKKIHCAMYLGRHKLYLRVSFDGW